MRATALILLLSACGANTDPCSGKSGVCIGLHVNGSVSGLDQLAVTIDQPGPMVQRTPNPPKSFNLPVKIALLPPSGTTGTVHISADGVSAMQIIAHGEVDATLLNGHAQVTLTLLALAGDMTIPLDADLAGVDFANDDMPQGDLSACPSVTTCQDGDGCCPSTCNNTNDKDCAPVCGNKVVEAGEICDDGNSVNGDGCDPTCQWTGIMTTVSGTPGGCGYADGLAPRFAGLSSIASDGTKIWASDPSTSTIRELTLTSALPRTATSSPLIGAAYDARLVDGPFIDARVRGFVGAPLIYLSGNQKLYFADDDSTNWVLREANLVARTVSTLSATVVKNNPMALATDGSTIFYLSKDGAVNKWAPGDSSSSEIASSASIGMGVCSTIVRSQGMTFLGCGGGVRQVTDAGVVTTYAGTISSPAPSCTDDANRANATFSSAVNLQVDSTNKLFAVSCDAIRQIGTGVTTVAGTLNVSGFVDGPIASALLTGGPLLLDPSAGNYFGDGCAFRSFSAGNNISTLAGVSPLVNAVDVRGTSIVSRYRTPMNGPFGRVGVVTDGTNLYAVGHAAGASGTLQTVISVGLASGVSTDLHTFTADGRAITRIGSTLYVALADGTIHSIGTDGMNEAVLAGMGGGATSPPSDGTAGNLRSAVMDPTSLGTDGTDLYFLDSAKLLRKITLSTATVSLVAGTQSSSDVVDGNGSDAHFGNPNDLVFVKDSLYTMDGLYPVFPSVVRRITLSTREVKTIAGQIGAVAFAAGDADGVGLAGQISGARYLASDGRSLFISDAATFYQTSSLLASPTIRQLDLASLSLTTMVGRRGQWTILNGTGVNALVHFPGPITFDSATHSLYFFDVAEGVFQKIR